MNIANWNVNIENYSFLFLEVWLFQAASRLHFLHEMGAEIHWGPYKPAVPLMVVSDPISQCLSLSSNIERLAAKGEHHFWSNSLKDSSFLLNGVSTVHFQVSGLGTAKLGYTRPWIGSLVSQEMVKLSFFWGKDFSPQAVKPTVECQPVKPPGFLVPDCGHLFGQQQRNGAF